MKKITKIIVIGLLIIISSGLFAGCGEDPSRYTVEEHIQRISERIEERYIKDSEDYTSFEVYPLYGLNDEVYCFLVEFEPFGFLYVKAFKVEPIPIGCTPRNSMYALDDVSPDREYRRSPYCVPDIQGEKLYLLDFESEEGSIPAIKRGEKYLNLISMEYVDMIDGKLTKKQASIYVVFIVSSHFDL